MATNSLIKGTGFEPISGDVWSGIDPTTGLPYQTDQGVPQPNQTGGATTNPIIQDPETGMPIGTNPGDFPSFGGTGGTGGIDSLSGALTGGLAGGTSGDFDPNSLEGIDQQIAQIQSQIDASSGGAVPDYSAFFQSPGYQFRQDEGIRAIDRSASARGQLMSGGTLRELQRYGQGLAAT